MVASSRVRKAGGRLGRTLWLTTLLAALLYSGMCLQGWLDPDLRATVTQAVEADDSASLPMPSSAGDGARYQAGDDGDHDPGRDVPPGHRHHHAVLRAPALRTGAASAAGPVLIAMAPVRTHDTRLIERRRTGERPRRVVGASLLTMIGVSRT
ncbi:hypothetical protein ACRYCC_08985 [Actinomadura scrupuli]|uniref:hypothetical protein n=1 Tax=Actinomadura scrupuli TaxID=559629 RepID=UPI003D99DE98